MSNNIELNIINNNDNYNVTNVLEKVKWSGDYKSCARKVEFSLDSTFLPFKPVCGDFVVLLVDSKKVFEGIIWDESLDSSKNSINILAYDKGVYLLKNKLAYNFKSTKAESIASKVAADLGISIGNIATTGVDITKLFLGVNAYEIIMTAYTEASKKTGKKYMCYIKEDKLYVELKGVVTLDIAFEEGKNLINTTIKNSLENMVNKVVIVDDKGNKKEEVKNDNWIKLYGTLQDIVQVQEDKNAKEEAKSKLKDKETTCSLSGYGDISCITGKGVQVKDTYTNMIGLFYIDTDTHTWENGDYQIDLCISLQNLMNEVSAGQDENKDSKGSTSSSTSSQSSNEKANKAVDLAKGKIGKSYVWGATGPNSFDCSGLTSWAYKQVGISIPRTSSAQSTHGKSISKSNLEPGDLVFFSTNGTGKVSHVGMYIGNGNMVHAANPSKGVRTDSINSSYYSKSWKGARRVV